MSASNFPNPFRQITNTIREMRDRHRDRHRSTGFGFAFADKVDYLNADLWDSVANCSSVFLRREILRVIEQHGPQNIVPRYAIVFRDEKPVATIAAQIVSITGEHINAPTKSKPGRNILQRALDPATKVATSRIRERILVGGNLLSWGFHGIAFAPGENTAELWPAVAEALYRIRRAERLTGQTDFVMLKDLTAEQAGLESLHRFSYRPLETEPNMVLDINPAWQTYDDYLAALTSAYRKSAKDQLKKLTSAGCTIERLTDVTAHAQRLHELYISVQSNAAVRLVTVPETYFPALAQAAGDNFRCTAIKRGEEIIGFVTSIRDGDTAIGYYIGFDRSAAANGLPIYLRLLHSTIADAIDWHCKRLSLGRTALEPKATLGAKPEKMSVWIRHRVPTFNWLFRGLLGGVPHAEAPERNPFKAGEIQ